MDSADRNASQIREQTAGPAPEGGAQAPTDIDRQTAGPARDTWPRFVEDCEQCRGCSLGNTRRNTVVFRGAVRAPLMLIGEGPGAEEDIQGKPFVGQAGRLLDLLLTALGFPADSFHVANIVKCRPPENRVPTPDEAKACRPLLARQFRFVKPTYIVLLGATAFKYFTGMNDGITKVRGQWIEKGGYHIMPTLHPAYILRNNRERGKLFADLADVRARMEQDGILPPLARTPEMPEGRG